MRPSTSLFIDKIEIKVASGNGGAGCISFRREAKVPRGGPDGGDGGRGGHVYIVGDRHKHTLLDYKYKKNYFARNGMPGLGAKCYGKAGADAILPVPLGTQIRNKATGELILDVVDEGKHLFLEGGKGGLGNWHFKNARMQAPEYAQGGIEGESVEITLELKLLADIGLVGFPNAGKSTLISVLSKARPKVASYPFTTLNPQLGVMEHKHTELVIADLPGLIEGAAEGVGLGHRFLRHAERTSEILHLVSLDPSEVQSPYERYLAIRKELENYENPSMDDHEKRVHELKERVLLTKADICPRNIQEQVVGEFRQHDIQAMVVSSASHQNIEILKDSLIKEEVKEDGE
ncbi:MAG: Obg family GTPase CgtA [Bdellovibrionales bacterium]